uniref:Putative secreted protein n=1 Tax=Panstrongylus lignarius TaxID=156445 RepID=A0A224Y275_9HEMI
MLLISLIFLKFLICLILFVSSSYRFSLAERTTLFVSSSSSLKVKVVGGARTTGSSSEELSDSESEPVAKKRLILDYHRMKSINNYSSCYF